MVIVEELLQFKASLQFCHAHELLLWLYGSSVVKKTDSVYIPSEFSCQKHVRELT